MSVRRRTGVPEMLARIGTGVLASGAGREQAPAGASGPDLFLRAAGIGGCAAWSPCRATTPRSAKAANRPSQGF